MPHFSHIFSSKVYKKMALPPFHTTTMNDKAGFGTDLGTITAVRLLLTVILLITAMSLAGCEEAKTPKKNDGPRLGTRLLIKQQSYELLAEIVSVENDQIGINYYWQGEQIYSNKLYRGLIDVWNKEGSTIRETSFDTTRIDALFPLELGKSTSMTAVTTNLSTGNTVNETITLEVTQQSQLTFETSSIPVFLLEMIRTPEGQAPIYEQLYYAPQKGLVMKVIISNENGQSFWRVLEIDDRSDSDRRTLQQRNRQSGAIAI